MNQELSIIIVSYNTKKLLRKCLSSIYLTTKDISLKIIVIDNGSSDGSPEMIETEFKKVKLIRNTENIGFARANNRAAKFATGPYILFLNSDCVLQHGTIEKLIYFIKRHPKAAAVGPKVIYPSGLLQSKGELFPSIGKSLLNLFRVNRVFGINTLYKLFPRHYWDENDSKSIDSLIGCCLLIAREVFNKIGPFSDSFFMYGEEVEWCFRAKKHGYEIWYVSDAEVVHFGEGSPLENRYEWKQKGFLLFYQMSVGRIRGIIVTAIDVLFLYTRLLGISIRSCKVSGHQYNRVEVEGELIPKRELLKLLVTSRGFNKL